MKSDKNSKRAVWFEIGAVALLICASWPSLSSLGCSLLWGSKYAKLAEQRRDAKTTATEYETALFEQGTFYAQLVPVVLFVMWRSGESWSHFGLVRPKFGRDIVLGLGIWLVVAILAAFLALAFQRSDPWKELYPIAIPWHRAILLLGNCCAIGFWQELTFRAYLIPRLEAVTGATWKSVVLSVVLFAAMHQYDGYYGIVHAALGGTVWSIAFCSTRSLWPVTISHAIIDFFILTHFAATVVQ